MAVKVKNETHKRIGVATPAGIYTLAPGKSAEYDDVSNQDALKKVGAKVSGKNKSETEQEEADKAEAARLEAAKTDAQAKADADAKAAADKAKQASIAEKPAQAGQASAGATGTKPA